MGEEKLVLRPRLQGPNTRLKDNNQQTCKMDIVNPQDCSIVVATSQDDRFPPENILDGNHKTFFTTTGLYPQEVVVHLGGTVAVDRLRLQTYGVRQLVVESSGQDDAQGGQKLVELEFGHTDGEMHTFERDVSSLGVKAQTLRLIVSAGWIDFCSIHSLGVIGHRQ